LCPKSVWPIFLAETTFAQFFGIGETFDLVNKKKKEERKKE
jgi:hypothetical protein